MYSYKFICCLLIGYLIHAVNLNWLITWSIYTRRVRSLAVTVDGWTHHQSFILLSICNTWSKVWCLLKLDSAHGAYAISFAQLPKGIVKKWDCQYYFLAAVATCTAQAVPHTARACALLELVSNKLWSAIARDRVWAKARGPRHC